MEEKDFEKFTKGFDEVINEVENIYEVIDKFLSLVKLKGYDFDKLTENQKIILNAKEMKFERLIKGIKQL